MDEIMKTMLNMTMEEDIQNFLLKSENGDKIDVNEIYFAHTIDMDSNQPSKDEEYRAVIDSSVRTPHNRFFVDIIHKEGLGIANGWTGFAMIPNSGRCVDAMEHFSKIMKKDIVAFSEIEEFVQVKNEELKGNHKSY